MLSFHHLLESSQISNDDIDKILNLAADFKLKFKSGTPLNNIMNGSILATLFFEPSTRTRFSFESAMMRLGGNVITLEQGQSCSAKKGESLQDMGAIVSSYCDLIVFRHPEIGSAAQFAKNSDVKVINAGDGSNQHPTQALTDIYTIFDQKKRLNNIKIGVMGDLKHSRTVFSLLSLLAKYSDNEFILISDETLHLDNHKKQILQNLGVKIVETDDLQSVIKDLDVLYVTRIQKERFDNYETYQKIKNSYHIEPKSLINAKSDLIIMHPLPRVNEIAPEVDKLSYAKYFQQAKDGVFVRMALMALMQNKIN